ncbi:MAG: hypothetical protein WCI76_00470 [bacterium]
MFTPDKLIHRNEKARGIVETRLSEIYEHSELFSQENLSGMFGLGEATLTPEEVAQLQRYVSYVGKRILNATLAGDENLKSPKEVSKKLKKHLNNLHSLALHDVAHSFVAYQENQGVTNNLVPKFLTGGEGREYLLEIYKDEVYALLWWNSIGKDPIFIALMYPDKLADWQKEFDSRMALINIPEIKEITANVKSAISKLDHSNFESVLAAYLEITLNILKIPVVADYLEAHNSTRDEGLDRAKEEYDDVAEELKRSRDPRFTETAKEIFDNHKTDPKILFHKFQQICAPLLQRLEKVNNKAT